mgnify:CR=1 FL=1
MWFKKKSRTLPELSEAYSPQYQRKTEDFAEMVDYCSKFALQAVQSGLTELEAHLVREEIASLFQSLKGWHMGEMAELEINTIKLSKLDMEFLDDQTRLPH